MSEINYLNKCKKDKKERLYFWLNMGMWPSRIMVISGISIFIIMGLAIGSGNEDEFIYVMALVFLLGLLVTTFGLLIRHTGMRMTETHLEQVFISIPVKRILLDEITAYEAGCVITADNKRMVLKMGSVRDFLLGGGAHFIKLLEERTGVMMFTEISGYTTEEVLFRD